MLKPDIPIITKAIRSNFSRLFRTLTRPCKLRGGLAYTSQFGYCNSPGPDITYSADFDGDGKTDLSTYRWGTGQWRYKRSSDGLVVAISYGLPGSDLPSPGDYDGDGRTDPTVFRQTGAYTYFYVYGYPPTQWGLAGDYSVAFEFLTH